MRDLRELRCVCIVVALYATVVRTAVGQAFSNLNFELAQVGPTAPGQWGDQVDPAKAFPGWTVSFSCPHCQGEWIAYNTLSLGSQAAILMGPSFPNGPGFTPLQGSYSVLLITFYTQTGNVAIVSQTGLVPVNARSINFLVGPETWQTNALVRWGGVNIPLVPIGGGRVAGDVSAFAGKVEELSFSTPVLPPDATELYFDDVKFSSSPIPEPGTSCLVVMGVLLVACRAVKRD